MKYYPLAALLLVGAIGCNDSKHPNAAKTPSASSTSTTERDNTAVNERDRSDAAKTPIDQNENKADIDITANIRKRVTDSEMSVNAQNVKIVTQDGKVTLRGPVATAEEKQKVEDIAREIAGDGKVDSQLEIESR